VDFELFRPELNAALSYTDQTEGGRPPFDPVLMFKILVIQATNNLNAPNFSSMTGCRLCGPWDWGWRTVFRTPARFGCSGRADHARGEAVAALSSTRSSR
jgi:hypothetical protein